MAKKAGLNEPSARPKSITEESGVRALDLPSELAALAPVRPEAHGRTELGHIRENNEDQFLIADLERTLVLQQSTTPARGETKIADRRQGFLFVVADGMGGYEGGEVASAVAVEAMVDYALGVMPWLLASSDAAEHELAEGLRTAMQSSHERVRAAARERRLDIRMGTTLTVAYAVWPRLYLLHAGDSRAYLYRAGGLYQLTRDHTLSQRLVEQNVLTKEQAACSRFSHILLNTVGGQAERVHVELHQLELRRRDMLLLCTDGLTGELKDEAIAAHLAAGGPVARITESLVQDANRAGGRDNITVIVARF